MSKNFVFFIIFIIFIFSILHLLGWRDFYYTTIWYDKLLHFLAGIGVILIVWRLMDKKILISFLFLLIIAVLWEVFEFGIDKVFNLPSLQLGLNDTLWDLIFDISGGIFGVGLCFWFGRDKL